MLKIYILISTADLLYRTAAGNTLIPAFSSFLIFLSSASSSSGPFSTTQVNFFWMFFWDTTAPSFNTSTHSCLWGSMGNFRALTDTLVDNMRWIKETRTSKTDHAFVYWFLLRCMMCFGHRWVTSSQFPEKKHTLTVFHSSSVYLRGRSPPTGDVELLKLLLSSSLSLLLFLRGAGR